MSKVDKSRKFATVGNFVAGVVLWIVAFISLSRDLLIPCFITNAGQESGHEMSDHGQESKYMVYPAGNYDEIESQVQLHSVHGHTPPGKSRGRGRARLPEKLMGHLNAGVAPSALWWLPGEEAFAIDSSLVQTEVLDVYFRGTKLSSFIRSLNRWYVTVASRYDSIAMYELLYLFESIVCYTLLSSLVLVATTI